ncbi:MAG: VWA domain-containing protein, partial [Pseudomonadota bacterium]
MRLTTLCAAAVLLAPAAQAQERPLSEAVALVEALVGEHLRRFETGGDPLLNDAAASRPYLEDGLAQDGLQSRLQFDPLFDAQDLQITDLVVGPNVDTPLLQGAAMIVASFRNFGQPMEIHYTLVPVTPTGAWQISDIYSPANGWNLANLAGRGATSEPEILFAQAGGGASASPGAAPADEEEVGMEQGDLPSFAPDASRPDLLFILDGSGSMWGQIDGVAKITTAKQALTALAADLAGTTNLGLMAYGHRREGDCGDTQVLLSTGQYEPRVIADMVEGVSPRGKTPIAASLLAAPQAFTAGDRTSEILLISDGLETCGGDPCAAAASLRAQGVQTRVHVVGFDLTAEEQAALSCIAEEGGGLYLTADTAEELGDALQQVAEATQVEEAPPLPPVEPEPVPEPSPEPVAPTPSEPTVVFEETFDGPAISESWSVENPAPELATLNGEGALFVAAIGETTYRMAEARNRYVLD